MDFLTDFGVKPILLLAQVVNFIVLFLILKRFLYKPLLKVLAERKEKISNSLKNAEEIEVKLAQTTKDREERLRETSKEAEEIIAEATKNANQIIAEAHTKASRDIEQMLEKSKVALEQERVKLRQEIRFELANLVVLGLQKVTGKVVTEKEQKQLIERSIQELN